MKKLIFSTLVAILCVGCVIPRYFRPSKEGMEYLSLQDSVDVSVSYMETIKSFSKKHLGSSISIKSSDESKHPIEISINSLRKIKTTNFDLVLDTLYYSNTGTRKEDVITFPDSNFYIMLVYNTLSDKKEYLEAQRVFIPSFMIKHGEKVYTKESFEAVYRKR